MTGGKWTELSARGAKWAKYVSEIFAWRMTIIFKKYSNTQIRGSGSRRAKHNSQTLQHDHPTTTTTNTTHSLQSCGVCEGWLKTQITLQTNLCVQPAIRQNRVTAVWSCWKDKSCKNIIYLN